MLGPLIFVCIEFLAKSIFTCVSREDEERRGGRRRKERPVLLPMLQGGNKDSEAQGHRWELDGHLTGGALDSDPFMVIKVWHTVDSFDKVLTRTRRSHVRYYYSHVTEAGLR